MISANFLTPNFQIWPWSPYSRYMDGSYGSMSGYGRGTERPAFCASGGFLFFTDTDRNLWKYDGRKVYPLGLPNNLDWEGNRILASPDLGFNLEAFGVYEEFTDFVLDADHNTATLSTKLSNVTICGNQGWYAGTTGSGVLWVAGYPFHILNVTTTVIEGTEWIVFSLEGMDQPNMLAKKWQGFNVDTFETMDPIGRLDVRWQTKKFVVSTQGWGYIYRRAPRDFGMIDAVYDDMADQTVEAYAEGNYGYLATLLTKHGYESNPCQLVTVNNGKKAVVLWLYCKDIFYPERTEQYDWGGVPVSFVTHLRLYRTTTSNPGIYYHVIDIPLQGYPVNGYKGDENGYLYSVLEYRDIHRDTELGHVLHDWKIIPKKATALASVKNTLCVADVTGIYVSDLGDPESFYDFLTLEDEVVGLFPLPYYDRFAIFLKNRIYTMDIYSRGLNLVADGIGLVGRDAATIIGTSVIFQAPGGLLYAWTGGALPQPIPNSDKIRDLLLGLSNKRRLNVSQYKNTKIVYLQKRRQVWVNVGTGTSDSDTIIVIDLDSFKFSLYQFPFNITAISTTVGGNEGIMLADEQGYVYTFTEGARSDNGVPIECMLETPEIGQLGPQMRIRRIYTEVISGEDIVLNVSGKYDRGPYISEGQMAHVANDRGDERYMTTYSTVVPTYQFKISESSSKKFVLKRFSVILQVKGERFRHARQ